MEDSPHPETDENTSPIRRLSGGLMRLLGSEREEEEEEPMSDSLLDTAALNELGNILEDEDFEDPLLHDDEDDDFDDYYEEDDDDDPEISAYLSNLSGDSFHLGSPTQMSARNIMVRERRTSSFWNHGDEYELINTQLKNNVRLVEDVNLIDDAKGRLYLAKHSFFKNVHDLKFAMTIQPDIYQKILTEVNDSANVPCDLYFCCHGGDGAHTGVSHNDYVNIKLAWFFLVMLIGILMAVDVFVQD